MLIDIPTIPTCTRYPTAKKHRPVQNIISPHPELIDQSKCIEIIESVDPTKYNKLASMLSNEPDSIYIVVSYCVQHNYTHALRKIISNGDFDLKCYKEIWFTCGTHPTKSAYLDILIQLIKSNFDTMFELFLETYGTEHEPLMPKIETYIVTHERINFIKILTECQTQINYDLLTKLSIQHNKINMLNHCIQNNSFIQSAFDQVHTNLVFDNDNDNSECPLYGFELILILIENFICIDTHLDKILVVACINSDLELATYCITHGADIHYQQDLALRQSTLTTIITYLLQSGADISLAFIPSNCTELHSKIFRTIKPECNIDFDYLMFDKLPTQNAECIKRTIDNVILLLNYGLVIEKEKLSSIIESAITADNVHVGLDQIEFFLDRGADPAGFFSNKLVLESIVSYEKIPILKFIAETYYDRLKPELDRLVLVSVANGYIDLTMYLINLGADIHTEDDKAMLMAMFFGHGPMVKLLIELGINIHTLKHDPFLVCADGYDESLIEYFSFGTSYNLHYYDCLVKDSNSFAIDKFTYGSDHRGIFNLLIEAKVSCPSNQVFNTKHAINEVYEYCFSMNIDLNEIITTIDNVPLIHAIANLNTDRVRFLLEHGANPNTHNLCAIGRALQHAKRKPEILKLCLAHCTYDPSINTRLHKFTLTSEVADIFRTYGYL